MLSYYCVFYRLFLRSTRRSGSSLHFVVRGSGRIHFRAACFPRPPRGRGGGGGSTLYSTRLLYSASEGAVTQGCAAAAKDGLQPARTCKTGQGNKIPVAESCVCLAGFYRQQMFARYAHISCSQRESLAREQCGLLVCHAFPCSKCPHRLQPSAECCLKKSHWPNWQESNIPVSLNILCG